MKELLVQDSPWKGDQYQPEQLQLPTVVASHFISNFSGTPIYSDAAWSLEPG